MFGIPGYAPLDFTGAKEALSLCALQSIISHSFGVCEPSGRQRDMMGIDSICNFEWQDEAGFRCAEFNVQLKGTSRLLETKTYNGRECWSFPIESRQLEKYRAKTNVPLMLILVLFPGDDEYERWLEILEDSSVLRRQIYWAWIDEIGDSKSTAYVPKSNRLTQETVLTKIVLPLTEGR